MATKGTKYYNLQTKMEQALKVIMLDERCNLLQAQLILRDVTTDAVDAIREEYIKTYGGTE